jgi:flagellin-like hook-associated protein FlgL
MVTLNNNSLFDSNLQVYVRQQRAHGESAERISSGKRINHVSQNPSQYVINVDLSQKIRAFSAANGSISSVKANLKVAISGAEKISRLLSDLRSKAIQGVDTSLTSSQQALLIADMKKLAASIEHTVDSSVFNDHNLIESNSVDIDDTTFASPGTLTGGFQRHNSLTSADFDGDGDLDLAATKDNDQEVAIFLNDGSGANFTNSVLATGMGIPREINSGDFNNDGNIDLAYTTGTSGDTLSTHVRFGNGDGSFSSEVNLASPDGTIQRLSVGDFNNDDIDDIAIAEHHSSKLMTHLSNGDGTFTSTWEYAASSKNYQIFAADLNSDGFDDIVSNEGGKATILINDGDGTFTSHSELDHSGNSYGSQLIDLDGDGDKDYFYGVSNNSYGYFRNDGGLSFTEQSGGALSPVSTTNTPGFGDFNSDGNIDFAFPSTTSGIAFHQGGGDSEDFPKVYTGSSTYTPIGAHGLDMNNDGQTDLVTNNSLGIEVRLNTGNGAGNNGNSITLNVSVDDEVFTVDGQGMRLTDLALSLDDFDTLDMALINKLETAIALQNDKLACLARDMDSLKQRFEFNTKMRDVTDIQLGTARDTDIAAESATFYARQTGLELAAQTLSISRNAKHLILHLFSF